MELPKQMEEGKHTFLYIVCFYIFAGIHIFNSGFSLVWYSYAHQEYKLTSKNAKNAKQMEATGSALMQLNNQLLKPLRF